MAYFTIEQNDMKEYFVSHSDTTKFTIPNKQGYFHCDKMSVDGNIIYKFSGKSDDDVCIKYEDSNDEYLFLSIILEGQKAYSNQYNQKKIIFSNSHVALLKINNTNGFGYYPKNKSVKSLDILINKSLESEFLKKHERKNNLDLIRYIKLSPKIQKLANEIYYCSFNGNLGKLYLQSKVSELLFLELLSSTELTDNAIVKFSIQDKKALEKAVEILRRSFENPPSIKELSKKVSLNEFKLKYGFKKFFNTAPYEMAISFKMQKAKELLEASELNIGEISSQIGFKYQGHFSKTFYKHFGILPKDVMRDRKYYY